jgi:septal ring factor EnvC (AmiA/AmiB activator)
MEKDTIKNIFLFCLFALFIVFFGLWYFKPSNTKDLNKALQTEIDNIQKQRDSLSANIKILEGNATILEDSIKSGEKRVAYYDVQLKSVQKRLTKANKDVQVASDYYSTMLKKLAFLQNHPNIKDGDALLQSLKDKLNR